MYGMHETKPLLTIGVIIVEKFTNIYMVELFKRDYQVYCIQCMQIKPCQYIGENFMDKTTTGLVMYFERTIYKRNKNVKYLSTSFLNVEVINGENDKTTLK